MMQTVAGRLQVLMFNGEAQGTRHLPRERGRSIAQSLGVSPLQAGLVSKQLQQSWLTAATWQGRGSPGRLLGLFHPWSHKHTRRVTLHEMAC